MGMDFYNYATPKAKKIHKCEMCGKPIEVGETYSYETGKWDGGFFDRKMHLKCFEMLSIMLCETKEDEFDWDELTDWWVETYCSKCKHLYVNNCERDEYCDPNYITNGICSRKAKNGCCKDLDTCNKITHICWCENFEREDN